MANCERPPIIPANLLPNDPAPIPPFWGCTALCRTVMYICHFFECDNCSAYHHKVAIMDKWTIKTPNPICWLFFKINLLTDFAALCSPDFIDWRYITHGWNFRPSCELLSDLLPPPALHKLNVQYIQTVCVVVGGGGGFNFGVDHIVQNF
jgi:hypothetical protein